MLISPLVHISPDELERQNILTQCRAHRALIDREERAAAAPALAIKPGTLERRSTKGRGFRIEADAEGRYVTGYAALFNSASSDLGGYVEKIRPGAFRRAIAEGQDVRHLINHDPTLILGRTKSGTLVLSEDSVGLKFKALLPATSYASDLIASVTRGDVDGCSFGFAVNGIAGQWWTKEGDTQVRWLLDVNLFDTSIVTYPAYPGTTAGVTDRSAPQRGMPMNMRLAGTTGASVLHYFCRAAGLNESETGTVLIGKCFGIPELRSPAQPVDDQERRERAAYRHLFI